MEHARPPAELTLEGGPACRADAWRTWLKQFQVFLKASGVYKEAKDVQASLLINLIGSEGYDVFTTLKFDKESDRDDIDILIGKFNSHFGTKTNTIMARFKFFTRNQECAESIDDYVTALKLLSSKCEFNMLEDDLIRDRVVCGIQDTTVRDRLLRSDDLSLQKAIKICQSSEISNEEGRHIAGLQKSFKDVSLVDAVWRRRGGYGRGAPAASGGGARAVSRASGGRSRQLSRSAAGGSVCVCCANSACNGLYCAAKSAKCYLCGSIGHYKKCCPVRVSKNYSRIYCMQENDAEEHNRELYYISTLDYQNSNDSIMDNKWCASLYFSHNNKLISHNFKLDTGSDLNVISKNNFLKLGFFLTDITPESVRAQSYCGNYLPIMGSCNMTCLYKNLYYSLKFVITSNNSMSILGKCALEQLGLVKRIFSVDIQDYKELFNGLGRLPGTYRIPIERDAVPVVCPVRKIPLGVRDKLRDELGRMEELGVIRKVSHPTAWVNGIVMVPKKNGDVRICLDPRPLNRVVRRQHFPLPTLMEIATKLRGARFYSKLDARSGFWMVALDEQSADLCTFGTPFGRYQFLRLPYGINSASEVFHAKVKQLLEDLDGVESFIDDVIVFGSTIEEHDRRLKNLLDRANEVGIKFNKEKCQFCVTQVTYLGHTFNAEGMTIDQGKLRAIMDMPSPNDRASLERFLGMINYLCKFIHNYSDKVLPLRSLLKKDVEWCWDENQERALQKLKHDLCSAPVLTLFAPDKPCVVSVDASSRALGAVLLQGGQPVEFASLTLTETQQRYAQIEKEMLAIVFALERFHQYIFGKSDVLVETDHKPLEALFCKSLEATPARLQRLMLRVQRYNFSITYKPGKYMYIADTLSRAALSELMHDQVTEEVEDQSCFLLQNVRFSDEKLKLVRNFTFNDLKCKLLIKYILDGWPTNKYDVPESVRPVWDYRETLEYVDGIIFRNNLVFIPEGLRNEMISRVHEGHLGINKCKQRAREVMFWPCMSRDIENAVRRCKTCISNAQAQPKEPMIPHHIPNLPWAKLGSDIFEFNRKYYLILVDYFSNYVEVCLLTSISSKSVILAMKDQFARHGIPQELITDNGPAYASKEFKTFANVWGFSHITSSPNYPQSNGRSERTVRTIKLLLKKASETGTDFHLSLLNYRAASRDGIASPAELLMGRRLNTRLPMHSEKLQTARDNSSDYLQMLRNQLKSKLQYDRHARTLPELHPGDEAILMDNRNRKRVHIAAKADRPRSYFVTDSRGRHLIRNRRHLLKCTTINAKSSEAVNDSDESSVDSVYAEITDNIHDSTYQPDFDETKLTQDSCLVESPEKSPPRSTPTRHERKAARDAKLKLNRRI